MNTFENSSFIVKIVKLKYYFHIILNYPNLSFKKSFW